MSQASASTSRSFGCPHPGCGKSFPKPAKLDRHLRSHSDERPFVCQHTGCDASYKRSEHLKVHQRSHLDASQKSFHCTEQGCSMSFWTSSHLKNHIRSVHKDETVRLGSRTIEIPSFQRLDGSTPCKDGAVIKEYPCTEPGCTETFHKRKVLRAHIREVHTDVAVAQLMEEEDKEKEKGHEEKEMEESIARKVLLPFPCHHPGCSMRFSTNSKRKAHAKTHQEGRYTCSMSHDKPQHPEYAAAGSDQQSYIYTFPNWTALQAHMKEEHPPKCTWPGCDKTFTRQDNLRAHYKRHENRKLRLEAEAQIQGMQKDGMLLQDFKLDDAETDSGSESDFDLRIETPSQMVPKANGQPQADFTAMACELFKTRPRRSSRFSTPTSSPALLSASPGLDGVDGSAIGIFRCTWNGCDRVFTRKSGLSLHIRTSHLGESPFACTGCGRKFGHKHLVSRHQRVCLGAKDEEEASTESPGVDDGVSADEEDSPEAGEDGDLTKEEDENDYFRAEGGAVPERDADRGKASKSARFLSSYSPSSSSAMDSPGRSQGKRRAVISKGRLLGLLTGEGYSGPASEGDKHELPEDDQGEMTRTKRRRVGKDRALECPWHSIISMSGTERLSGGIESSEPTSEMPQEAETGSSKCPYRFSRVYDLRRHLKASHGLDLEDREVRSWLARH